MWYLLPLPVTAGDGYSNKIMLMWTFCCNKLCQIIHLKFIFFIISSRCIWEKRAESAHFNRWNHWMRCAVIVLLLWLCSSPQNVWLSQLISSRTCHNVWYILLGIFLLFINDVRKFIHFIIFNNLFMNVCPICDTQMWTYLIYMLYYLDLFWCIDRLKWTV